MAVIMKRTPLLQDKSVEIITYGVYEGKGINELKVNEGVNLYIDE